MYCRKCGTEIPENANTCPYCGTEVYIENNLPKRSNGMAIAAIITSFISPILGWIFGIIAMKRTNNGYDGKGIAIAAIIIATLNFILNIYLMSTGYLDDILQGLM